MKYMNNIPSPSNRNLYFEKYSTRYQGEASSLVPSSVRPMSCAATRSILPRAGWVYFLVVGLKNHIGYRYCIQSVLAFSSGQRSFAISIVLKSLFFNPSDTRSWFYAVRSLLPRGLLPWLDQKRRNRRSR